MLRPRPEIIPVKSRIEMVQTAGEPTISRERGDSDSEDFEDGVALALSERKRWATLFASEAKRREVINDVLEIGRQLA
jgi:hypothetical protein